MQRLLFPAATGRARKGYPFDLITIALRSLVVDFIL